jgi:ribosomal protein S27AE
VKDKLVEMSEMPQPLHECPNCSKQALVQRSPDKYHCIWCGFSKDLSAPPESPSGSAIAFFWAILLAICLFFLSQVNAGGDLQDSSPSSPPSDRSPPASN